jgi:uncharacterized protein YecE (DUF72 family)
LRLARRHDPRVSGRACLRIDRNRKLHHAIEIRHESFIDPAFVKLLRRQRIALVVADTAGKWPLLEVVTADFCYVRLHGDAELYVSGYSDESLDRWAALLDGWRTGRTTPDGRPRDVHVYFDNDVKVRAPYDAMALAARLDVTPDAAG